MRPCPNGEARTENATTVERGFEGVSEIACNPSENPESSARRKSGHTPFEPRSVRGCPPSFRRCSGAVRIPLGQPRFRPDDRERRSLSDFRRALSRLFPNSRKTERSYIEGCFRPFAAGFAKWMRRRRKEGSRRGGGIGGSDRKSTDAQGGALPRRGIQYHYFLGNFLLSRVRAVGAPCLHERSNGGGIRERHPRFSLCLLSLCASRLVFMLCSFLLCSLGRVLSALFFRLVSPRSLPPVSCSRPRPGRSFCRSGACGRAETGRGMTGCFVYNGCAPGVAVFREDPSVCGSGSRNGRSVASVRLKTAQFRGAERSSVHIRPRFGCEPCVLCPPCCTLFG